MAGIIVDYASGVVAIATYTSQLPATVTAGQRIKIIDTGNVYAVQKLVAKGVAFDAINEVVLVDAFADVGSGDIEGAAVLSTGEVGGTKFLREDGDGTCSWQTVAVGGATALSTGTVTNTTYGITSDGGVDDVVIAQAVASTSSGVMSGTDKTKLDGIEALADVTDAGNISSAIVASGAKGTPIDADTMPLIDSADANALKKVTIANLKLIMGGGSWSVKAAGYTAVAGDRLAINTTAGTVTITLPAGVANDTILLKDYAGLWGTNKAILAPNGAEKIMGVAANYDLDATSPMITLTYIDATRGWII